jgi:hypothetical protein
MQEYFSSIYRGFKLRPFLRSCYQSLQFLIKGSKQLGQRGSLTPYTLVGEFLEDWGQGVTSDHYPKPLGVFNPLFKKNSRLVPRIQKYLSLTYIYIYILLILINKTLSFCFNTIVGIYVYFSKVK